MPVTNPAQRMITKLQRRLRLDDHDRDALQSIPFTIRELDAGRHIIREGAPLNHCTLLLEGFMFRQKITTEGARQIVGLQMPGDFIDLEGALLKVADHNVQALTHARIATMPVARIVEVIESHPRLARALWIDTLIDASISREWMLNVGRRNALQRIGHLLCETALRLELVGLGTTQGFDLPMTQEQVADATGLTSVHVNRSMKMMEAAGLIRRDKRRIAIPDWNRLRDQCGFSALYLHLDQRQL